MTSAVRGASRSSARLVKKQEAKNRNTETLSHNTRISETSLPLLKVSPDSSVGSHSTSKCSAGSNGNSQSLHVGSTCTSAIRTTTSRRGGRSGLSHSPRAALKQSQSKNLSASAPLQVLSGKSKEKTKREMSPAVASTPSSAAAAAAAAAKALCDNPNRNRYGVDPYRGIHVDDRQNVFRARRDDGMGRITTRSTKNGIRKPNTSFGNSTLRVMGSHTPTHIPRHHDGCGSYERPRHEPRPSHFPPRGNTPSSVFRERLSNGPDPARNFDEMGSSPSELLLSLKSGSKSFDLDSPGAIQNGTTSSAFKTRDDGKIGKKHGNSPLSPEAPPRIQHSHHEAIKSDAFFFNPRTPKTPKTPNANFIKNTEGLHGTPSFSLFDKSFDSFGDSGYLRSPNVGSAALMEQALPSAFSLAPSYDDSPRKRTLSSPNPNFRFSFSPHKPKSQDLDAFPGDSPAISLDNVIVDAMDAPLMPRAPKSPATNSLLNPNVMVLEPSKTVRNTIPAPMISHESPQQRSSTVPLKKRFSPAPAYYGHRMAAHFRSPHADTDRRIRGAPPVLRQIKTETPSKVHPAMRHQSHPPSDHSIPIRPVSVHSHVSHGQGRPSPYYVGGRPAGVYIPEKKDTSLANFDADKMNKRLANHRHAFQRCSHLLPGFKKALSELSESDIVPIKVESTAVSVSPERVDGEKETSDNTKSGVDKEKEKADELVASRRVMSAICAFGGNSSGSGTVQNESHYKSDIANRYFEHQNRISWDVEEDPPVESPNRFSQNIGSPSLKRKDEFYGLNPNTPKKIKSDNSHGKTPGASEDDVKSTPSSSEAPKMRYRCKLCGQPKQNHTCPYQKSLQRSIGVTVHAAINAFTAAEPGDLAPALAEMNNFVHGNDVPEMTPARPRRAPIAPLFRDRSVLPRSAPHVTPEVIRSMNQARKAAGYSVPSQGQFDQYAMAGRMMPPTPVSNIRRRRILSPEKSASKLAVPSHKSDLVFVEANRLRTEQFRLVSTKAHTSFKYPTIPLPYPQRKALSDNLFELSNELPSLKEECALILRKARETNVWDIAVAELLAQFIVAIHCPEKDTRLEGLSRYLSSLGIAC